MKYCVAVEEIRRREIVVDAGSLEDAIAVVEKAYKEQKIILDRGDIVPETMDRIGFRVYEADWYGSSEVQEMETGEL